MRTAFWAVSAAVFLAAAGAHGGSQIACSSSGGWKLLAQLPSGVKLAQEDSTGVTTLRITRPEASKRPQSSCIALERDDSVEERSPLQDFRVLGELKEGVIITDSYSSKPGPMSYCQAGQESFLRVIAWSSSKPRETLKLKLSSCRENLELGSPGFTWNPESSTLGISWLSGPAGPGKSESRHYHIDAQGTAQQQ